MDLKIVQKTVKTSVLYSFSLQSCSGIQIYGSALKTKWSEICKYGLYIRLHKYIKFIRFRRFKCWNSVFCIFYFAHLIFEDTISYCLQLAKPENENSLLTTSSNSFWTHQPPATNVTAIVPQQTEASQTIRYDFYNGKDVLRAIYSVRTVIGIRK